DLIEEIGRIAGYDRIPVTPAVVTQELATATEHRVPPERYVDRLAARGWHEVITYGFVDERLDRLFVADGAPVPVANPIAADLNVLRRSLWPGLANVARQNLARQQTRFKLFEAGTRFASDGRSVEERAVLAGIAVGERSAEHWD